MISASLSHRARAVGIPMRYTIAVPLPFCPVSGSGRLIVDLHGLLDQEWINAQADRIRKRQSTENNLTPRLCTQHTALLWSTNYCQLPRPLPLIGINRTNNNNCHLQKVPVLIGFSPDPLSSEKSKYALPRVASSLLLFSVYWSIDDFWVVSTSSTDYVCHCATAFPIHPYSVHILYIRSILIEIESTYIRLTSLT